MQFINIFITCFLMQVVDVLGYNGFEKSPFFHFCQYQVSHIRLGIDELIIKNFFNFFPGLQGLFIEIFNFHKIRMISIPQSSFTSKRRDAALHRNPCTCKGNHILRIPYKFYSFCNLFNIHIPVSLIARQ